MSARLVREMHEILLRSGRGAGKQPGEFRRTQNWIGGRRPSEATFVPPPAHRVEACFGALEQFIHDDRLTLPILVKAALAHVQFETIHPFLDGNGRVGRILITLLLCAEGALSEPLLYLSLYFKKHRSTYYQLLQDVRLKGAWEAWIGFFLDGVIETAEQAASTARRLIELVEHDRRRIASLPRQAGTLLRLHELLQQHSYVASKDVVRALSVSQPTADRSLRALEELGIVREASGRGKRRVYEYDAYVAIIAEGTEPIGPD